MNQNTQYIQGLNYDLKKLLAVNLQSSSQPACPDREHKSGQVIVCKKTPRNITNNLSESSLLNPSMGVIFPGALIKQDQTLAEGLPTPYTLPRAPLTIRIGLPGLGGKELVTIASPTSAIVETEIEKVVDYWLDNVRDKGYKTPIRAFSNASKSYTKEQIGVEMGFGAQWGKSSATASLKTQSSREETVVYQMFKQIYYTVYIDNPAEAGAVFADSVKLDSTNMPATQPAGIVRSVDYGRLIVVQMTTTSNVTEVDAEAAVNYCTATGTQISGDLKTKYENIAKNSQWQVLVLGGGSDSAQLLTGDYTKIGQAIANGIEFSKNNPAYPVSFIVADLKTQNVSQIKTTTDYIETNCWVMPDCTVTVKHKGAYVAKFVVKWNDAVEGAKSWDSGKKTAGYEYTLPPFPGDTTDISVTGIDDTGLVWDKHHEKTIRYNVLDGNKTVTIGGTTLNMTISG
jgi:thiol-activated cytolysin